MKPRVSLVQYLNSAPLGWAFLHGPLQGRYDVTPSFPSVCADQLAKGEVDIGLIPSIEYQRIPNLKVIPGISISSLAAVRSLLLIRHKGTHAINSVALDTTSRTSVALTQILIRDKMGLNPSFVPHPPDPVAMLKVCDAALLIGDAALKVNIEDYETVDLTEAWVEWQQRPFVCALWACRSDVQLPEDLIQVFQEAKRWGLTQRADIASVFAASLDLPKDFLEGYLYQNINYDLEPDHINGLKRFYQLAKEQELIAEVRDLEFMF
jgi:chorismate dehydratase